MIHKTRGIVLNFVKYGENSIIVNIYTEQFGRTAFIVNSVRGKKSKIALYQPLSLVDLVIYYKEGRNINRISETRSIHPISAIRREPVKIAIGLFIAEILIKCLKEETPNSNLFNFVFESITTLDTLDKEYQNFHLLFLFKLSSYLGFAPQNIGHFTEELNLNDKYKSADLKKLFPQLLLAEYSTKLHFTPEVRNLLLDDLINYYQIHTGLDHINSKSILHTVLQA